MRRYAGMVHGFMRMGGKVDMALTALDDAAAALKGALADPSLFARDAKAFNDKANKLGASETALAAAEEEWLALEMKREAIE